MGKGARNLLGMTAAAAAVALLSGCLEETTLYVGGEGNIRWYRLDESSGTLEPRGGIDYPHAATFFASSGDGRHLYGLLRTTNEAARIAAGLPLEGFVVSYAIDRRTGALTEIARRSSEGDRPTYVTLDKTGKFALVANNLGHLVGNSIVVFPVRPDGTPGAPVHARRTGIRAHQVRVHPSNKYVYVPNIDSDTVSQFAFDATTGALTPLDPADATVTTGDGPRHLDFHPNGRSVYLSNEYAANVDQFTVGDDGTLTRVPPAVSGLPDGYALRKWQSEIRVAPSGRFVYVGERVHESLAILSVDPGNGRLTLQHNEPSLGKTPRNFALAPEGNWLVVGNQESSSLVLFKADWSTGRLTRTDGPIAQPAPYVHLFVKQGP